MTVFPLNLAWKPNFRIHHVTMSSYVNFPAKYSGENKFLYRSRDMKQSDVIFFITLSGEICGYAF